MRLRITRTRKSDDRHDSPCKQTFSHATEEFDRHCHTSLRGVLAAQSCHGRHLGMWDSSNDIEIFLYYRWARRKPCSCIAMHGSVSGTRMGVKSQLGGHLCASGCVDGSVHPACAAERDTRHLGLLFVTNWQYYDMSHDDVCARVTDRSCTLCRSTCMLSAP